MQYKLIENSLNDTNNIVKTILLNRGIENPQEYLKLNDSCVQGYDDLDNMQEAVQCFLKHYQERNKIIVLPDCDPDGYTSSAMLYLYIKALDKDYPIDFIMHEKNKSHGLSDADFEIPSDAKLFIVADAATNDIDECNKLIDDGMDIIILDHHDQEPSDKKSKAIIVNNQTSEQYKNKNLCGAGVVYRFCEALDEELWENEAPNLLSLCALGLISDIMDLRSLESRYLVDVGLKNINNNMFQAFLDGQSYSTKGIVNIHNISWYITPIINALIRIGSLEDRTLMFRAFIDDYEEFDYKKRDGTIVKESIYERVVRLCKNAKSRQDKARDKIFEQLLSKVDLDDKVCIVEVDDVDMAGIVGLSAMKLSDSIQRPCIVVNRMKNDEGEEVLNGSCRNFNNSPVEDLKEVINSTGQFIFCQGHANAAGVSLYADNLVEAKKSLNECLKDIVYDPSYRCDFIIDIDDLSISFIQDIDALSWLWCTGIKEAVIAIENVQVSRKDIHIQGKNFDSITFTINNIKFVQFKLKDGDPIYDFVNEWNGNDDDVITLNIIGECSINDYKNILTPQITIQDCEIL